MTLHKLGGVVAAPWVIIVRSQDTIQENIMSDEPQPIPSDDQEIMLEIYRQKYGHIRHAQQMRATYFNFFLLVTVGSMAAWGQILLEDAPNGLAAASVGFAIWLVGVLTLHRVTLWSYHIRHDLVALRCIQNLFVEHNPATLGRVLAKQTKLDMGMELSRAVFSFSKSIEEGAATVGSVLGALCILVTPLLTGASLWVVMTIPVSIALLWSTYHIRRKQISKLTASHKVYLDQMGDWQHSHEHQASL